MLHPIEVCWCRGACRFERDEWTVPAQHGAEIAWLTRISAANKRPTITRPFPPEANRPPIWRGKYNGERVPVRL
jgi:hypothetical protein